MNVWTIVLKECVFGIRIRGWKWIFVSRCVQVCLGNYKTSSGDMAANTWHYYNVLPLGGRKLKMPCLG